MTLTARNTIRSHAIDGFTTDELRAFITKLENSVDSGYTNIDEETLDEWTLETLTARGDTKTGR